MTSGEPVAKQFLCGSMTRPFDRSEERGLAQMTHEQTLSEVEHRAGRVDGSEDIAQQMKATSDTPEHRAVICKVLNVTVPRSNWRVLR